MDDRGRALAAYVATDAWRAEAKLLKQDGQTSVFRGVDDTSNPIIVKRMVLRGIKHRIASMLARSRLTRQWRGSAMLQAAGIATASPRVLFRDGGTETLVLNWVEGPTVAELAAHGGITVRETHAIAAAIGTQALAIARAGIFNRDHKASNLVVHRKQDGTPEIVLIDTVGIRQGLTAVDLMLAKTMIELIGIGAPPRRTLCMRALKAAEPRHTKTAWRAIEQVIAKHGNPTPRVNPVSLRQ